MSSHVWHQPLIVGLLEGSDAGPAEVVVMGDGLPASFTDIPAEKEVSGIDVGSVGAAE